MFLGLYLNVLVFTLRRQSVVGRAPVVHHRGWKFLHLSNFKVVFFKECSVCTLWIFNIVLSAGVYKCRSTLNKVMKDFPMGMIAFPAASFNCHRGKRFLGGALLFHYMGFVDLEIYVQVANVC